MLTSKRKFAGDNSTPSPLPSPQKQKTSSSADTGASILDLLDAPSLLQKVDRLIDPKTLLQSSDAPSTSKEVEVAWCTVSTLWDFLPGLASCALWSVASSAIILLNKHLLSVHGFKAPMVLCSLGMLFSSVATFLLCRVFKAFPLPNMDKVDRSFYMKYLIPAGAAMAGNLALGNYTFLYLPVTYIQMLKSLAPAVNYMVLALLDMEQISTWLILAVSMIVFGTALASYGEIAFNGTGLALYLASELCEVTRVVIIQIMTQKMSFSPVEGLYFMAPIAVFWLWLGVLVVEYKVVFQENAIAKMGELPGWYALAGCLGFLVNITTWAVIKTTSALTLKVVGTAKNAATVWFGALLFGNEVTVVQIWGYGISLLGFAAYNVAKAMPKDDVSIPLLTHVEVKQ